jgi:phage regulator Rha-like protein
MKKNKLISIESLRMTSLEIAQLTNKEHFHVLRDIEKMCSDLEIDVQLFGDIYLDKYKRKQKLYELPKRETLILVSGYNIQIRAKIIDRWQELEIQVKQLKEKSQIRQVIKQDFKLMNDALKTSREHLGKETKGYHYSTESDLLYLIVLGKRSRDLEIEGDIRNNLSLEQIKALEHLQRANTTMLDMGLLYDERKIKLTEMYKKFYIKSLH